MVGKNEPPRSELTKLPRRLGKTHFPGVVFSMGRPGVKCKLAGGAVFIRAERALGGRRRHARGGFRGAAARRTREGLRRHQGKLSPAGKSVEGPCWRPEAFTRPPGGPVFFTGGGVEKKYHFWWGMHGAQLGQAGHLRIPPKSEYLFFNLGGRGTPGRPLRDQGGVSKGERRGRRDQVLGRSALEAHTLLSMCVYFPKGRGNGTETAGTPAAAH